MQVPENPDEKCNGCETSTEWLFIDEVSPYGEKSEVTLYIYECAECGKTGRIYEGETLQYSAGLRR